MNTARILSPVEIKPRPTIRRRRKPARTAALGEHRWTIRDAREGAGGGRVGREGSRAATYACVITDPAVAGRHYRPRSRGLLINAATQESTRLLHVRSHGRRQEVSGRPRSPPLSPCQSRSPGFSRATERTYCILLKQLIQGLFMS